MQDNAKCFVNLGQGIWEEITYEELEKRRKIIESYNKKKFIYIHGMLMEVSEKEYQNYFTEIERNRYCKKVLEKLQTISLEELNSEEEMRDKQVVADNNTDVASEVERKLELEELNEALMILDDSEYKLIKALFFQEKTIREYAKLLDIPFTTLQSRKELILKKLKKFLKN